MWDIVGEAGRALGVDVNPGSIGYCQVDKDGNL